MIAFLPVHNDDPALALSPLLRGTLLTLDYIETNGPIGLTPLKALKRYFVQWAAEVFVWPHYTAEDLYYLNKVLNEHDFPPLMVMHDVMLGAKLVRHYKGAMHSTRLGKELRANPGELWTVLTNHLLCVLDHSKYTRHGDQLVGTWDIFLNVINVEAHAGVSEERLCSVLFGREEEGFRRHDYQLAATFYIHVLRPLCWVGLLEEHRIGKALEQREVYTKTPLWAAALKLETDRHLREPTRH
jgi:hypothetical protein